MAERAKAEKACGRQIDDQEFASYLMYPKVFVEFAAAQRKYGPVAVLPTLTFFYGMKLEDELSIEIEDGKSLVVRLVALGETDDDGQVQVFFELNGQPRTIKVPNRSAVATRPAPPQGGGWQRQSSRGTDARPHLHGVGQVGAGD